MGSRYEVEVKIISAKDLKNVNWRYGPVKPYAVVWVDPKAKCSTRVDEEGDTNPYWDETLVIPLESYNIEDATLYIDIVHAHAGEDVKPLIGSAKIRLRDVVDDAGLGAQVDRKLELKRPSGRPHGKLEVKVSVREPRYQSRDPYYAPPYGVPPPATRGDYPPAAPYGNPYGAPPSGYPYGAPPPPQPYGQPSYGYQQPAAYGQQVGYGQQGGYGQPGYAYEEKKKSKFGGMGTGLAVGAVAGALGGLALAEGFDALEDHVADEAAEKVEEDLGYDPDDF
ncbi:protein SRC2 [Ipomoea triloba]|uniref:protein SRC2 n=1 Tax=Ipomoea triloba TaxID=35885 RepID=UPI00125D1245|nr:protein SRC2 [Ipomoea triloba]